MPKVKSSRSDKRSERLERHKDLMRAYLDKKNAPSKANIAYRTERDIIRENHKFVRSDEDDDQLTWEQRVAKNYYDRLYKEYALCNLKYYKEGKIALRWRTEKEVVSGKGQFICGSTHCDETKHLESWEVNFGYVEDGEKKNELVKVRLCERCSHKLNYKTKMKLAAKQKDRKRKSRHKKDKEESYEEEEENSNNEKSTVKDDDEQGKETSVWRSKLEAQQEKSREEEYEDYFADLLQ